MIHKRRKLITWSLPVITTVIMPAHAQTSTTDTNTASQTNTTITNNTLTTSAICEVNSVTPSSGDVNQGDTVTVNVTYTIINPPPSFAGTINFVVPLLPAPAVGVIQIGGNAVPINATTGTVDIQLPFNSPLASGMPMTAEMINAFIVGNTLQFPNLSPGIVIGSSSFPVDLTFNTP